jgi:hypothetical protein
VDLKSEQRPFSADDYRDNGLTPSPQSTPTGGISNGHHHHNNNNGAIDTMLAQQQQQQQQQHLLQNELYSGHLHLKRPPEGSEPYHLVSTPPPATNCSTGSASSYPSYLSSDAMSPLYDSKGQSFSKSKSKSKATSSGKSQAPLHAVAEVALTPGLTLDRWNRFTQNSFAE